MWFFKRLNNIKIFNKFITKDNHDNKTEVYLDENEINKVSDIIKNSGLYPVVIACATKETAEKIIAYGQQDLNIIKNVFKSTIEEFSEEDKDYSDVYHLYKNLFCGILCSTKEVENGLSFVPTLMTKGLLIRFKNEFNLRKSQRCEDLFKSKWSAVDALEMYINLGNKSDKQVDFYITR